MSDAAPRKVTRRTAVKWILGAAAGTLLADQALRVALRSARDVNAVGYGTDPLLTKIYKPGELWPLTLPESQRITAAALCDTIIPADDESPSASAVGVVDFIDEWVSAPYPTQARDRKIVLDGLAWIDSESDRRFGKRFAAATGAQRDAIANDICWMPRARPEHRDAAAFFARYRDLTTGGFYTTPEGTKDVGYIGNVAMGSFEGPSADLIRELGLDDA